MGKISSINQGKFKKRALLKKIRECRKNELDYEQIN